MLDVEVYIRGYAQALSRHLDGEGAARLDRIGQATELGRELAARVALRQVSISAFHGIHLLESVSEERSPLGGASRQLTRLAAFRPSSFYDTGAFEVE